MVRTYEDARERRRDREGFKERMRSVAREAPTDVMDINFADILIPLPDGLVPESVQNREGRRREASESIRRGLNSELSDSFGINLDDMEDAVSEMWDLDIEELDEMGILGLIASATRIHATLQNLMTEQQIVQLQILNDVATAVEPAAGVSVSGINDVTDAGIPQAVIPGSDEQEVPTRKLWMRASPQNKDDLYIGDDKIVPLNGFVLRPGEARDINLNFRDGILYFTSETEGDSIQLLGVV